MFSLKSFAKKSNIPHRGINYFFTPALSLSKGSPAEALAKAGLTRSLGEGRHKKSGTCNSPAYYKKSS